MVRNELFFSRVEVFEYNLSAKFSENIKGRSEIGNTVI